MFRYYFRANVQKNQNLDPVPVYSVHIEAKN